jgi:murein DD-endopeptidase MepM/ murein hydrolase activator NlpD
VNKLLVHPALDTKLSAIEIKLEVIKNRLTYLDSNGTSLGSDYLSEDELKSIPSILPTFGEISSNWGLRIHPILGGAIWHQGIDIANQTGTPVYATAEGIVSRVESDDGWGNVITIDHKDGYRTLYGHLYRSKVQLGDIVCKGQIIGLIGSTGMSTGPHLHYGVYHNGAPVNPAYYLNRQDLSYYNMVIR